MASDVSFSLRQAEQIKLFLAQQILTARVAAMLAEVIDDLHQFGTLKLLESFLKTLYEALDKNI